MDCCLNGGVGWSVRWKDRIKCELCKIIVVGIYYISFMLFYMGLEIWLDWMEICLMKICYEMLWSNGLIVIFEMKIRLCLFEFFVLLKVDVK